MIIRPDYIIYVAFAYMSCVSDAVNYSPIRNYRDTDPKYQPGRAIGELIGNMVINAMERKQRQKAGLDREDVREVGPEYDNEYRKEPSLDAPYERPGNDNDPKTDDLGYNDQYNSQRYPYNDGKYQVNNDMPSSIIRPDRPNKDLDYIQPPMNARDNSRKTMDEESYAIRGSDGNGNDNTYRDATSDVRVGVDDRYPGDREFVTNPNGTPNRVSQAGYESGIDNNVPLEPSIPPRREEIPEDADTYKGEMNYDNENGKLKTLTVKTFTFQAQPIKPESERNISLITLYYMD